MNIKTIDGDRIKKVERGFLILDDDTQIPHHRIMEIMCNDRIMWRKSNE